MWEVCCNTAKIYKHSDPAHALQFFQSATKPTTTEQTVAAKTTKQNCEKWSGKIYESQFFMEEWQNTNLENKIYDMIETVSLYNCVVFSFFINVVYLCCCFSSFFWQDGVRHSNINLSSWVQCKNVIADKFLVNAFDLQLTPFSRFTKLDIVIEFHYCEFSLTQLENFRNSILLRSIVSIFFTPLVRIFFFFNFVRSASAYTLHNCSIKWNRMQTKQKLNEKYQITWRHFSFTVSSFFERMRKIIYIVYEAINFVRIKCINNVNNMCVTVV